MLGLNNKTQENKSATNIKHAVIIFLWLSFTIAAFFFLTASKLTEFDPDKKLSAIAPEQLTSHIQDVYEAGLTAKTIIHFEQEDCNCNSASDRHLGSINQLAQESGYRVLNKKVIADKYIPSTPAIAIIDDTGSLLYLGPYGAGLACSQTKGFAQTVLNNHLLGYTAQVIVTAASGCYCNIS